MHNITYFFLLIITFTGFAQETTMLKGRVVMDTVQFEAIHIINKTKKIGVINDQSGYFEIAAEPEDTIVFSSVQYVLKEYLVRKEDLDSGNFKVKLEYSVNQLDEVVISQYTLSGEVKGDVKQIPTYEENLPLWNAKELKRLGVERPDDAQSSVKNYALTDEMDATPMNILGLVKLVGGAFKKKKKPKTTRIPKITELYSEDFLTKELRIPETEYYNFLDYVNEQNNTREILGSGDELKILEFLLEQSQTFRKKYQID
ncbi:hypothetical protein [Aquimarina sp. 2201CG5-10]|uniref:hypothetical protein n=1 Tax=Aquimarina callyspongiae TaxID=3098150 RepID=UPI002AB539DB|nr:hypothetical protein [Aquimarina sp. 2201CG5-10]MDY8136858.1 hypothetical protein [Aquimarina sp. 2201CG5-10]